MRRRTRWYVLLALAVLMTLVYSRFTSDWSDVAYYGGAAGVMLAVGAVGFPWMELATDGAFRRRPQAGPAFWNLRDRRLDVPAARGRAVAPVEPQLLLAGTGRDRTGR